MIASLLALLPSLFVVAGEPQNVAHAASEVSQILSEDIDGALSNPFEAEIPSRRTPLECEGLYVVQPDTLPAEFGFPWRALLISITYNVEMSRFEVLTRYNEVIMWIGRSWSSCNGGFELVYPWIYPEGNSSLWDDRQSIVIRDMMSRVIALYPRAIPLQYSLVYINSVQSLILQRLDTVGDKMNRTNFLEEVGKLSFQEIVHVYSGTYDDGPDSVADAETLFDQRAIDMDEADAETLFDQRAIEMDEIEGFEVEGGARSKAALEPNGV